MIRKSRSLSVFHRKLTGARRPACLDPWHHNNHQRNCHFFFRPYATALHNTISSNRTCRWQSSAVETDTPATSSAAADAAIRADSRVRNHVATQRLDAMIRLVEDLEMSSSSSSSSEYTHHPGKLNDALIYWVSWPASVAVASRKKKNQKIMENDGLLLPPLEYAQRILDWTMARNDEKLLEQVVALPNCSLNEQICRMIRLHSWSLQGTWSSLARDGYRKHDYVGMEEKRIGLYKASRLWETLQNLMADPQSNFSPDVVSLKTILLLWSRRIKFLSMINPSSAFSLDWNDDTTVVALGGKQSIQECLDAMKDLLEKLDDDALPEAGWMYGLLLWAYAQSAVEAGGQAAEEASKLLKRLEDDASIPLTTQHYNAVLSAYTNEARWDNQAPVEKSMDLWNHMKTLSVNASVSASDPITMSILLSLLAKSAQPERAQGVLEYMLARARETGNGFPELVHYNSCLTAWAKSRKPNADDRADALLQQMQRVNVFPDRISYTAAIEASLFSTDSNGMDRAETILASCEEKIDDEKAMPDTATYLTVFRGLLFRHRREIDAQLKEAISHRLERILHRMHERSKKSSLVQKPTTQTYSLVLEGWSRSHCALAATRAMALVQEMDEYQIAPDAKLYELALKCLCVRPDIDPTARVENAEYLQKQMEKKGVPQTLDVFNQYLRVLSMTGFVKEAERILVQALQSSTVELNENSYYAIIEGYAKSHDGEKDADRWLREYIDSMAMRSGVRPPSYMFAKVINSWSYSKDPNAMDRVEQLFEEACRYEKPNGYVYGTFISALRRSNRPDAPQRIEQILSLMQQEYESGVNVNGRPNASNFATAISCWAAVGQESAAERAEAILGRLEELNERDGDRYRQLKPTVACYKGVIAAWASSSCSDCGDRAIAILDRMEKRKEANSSAAVVPNRSCYRSAIDAVGKSSDKDKARKIYSILKRMDTAYRQGRRYARPNAGVYVDALRWICTTEGSPEERAAAFVFAQKALGDYHASTLEFDEGLHLQFLLTAFKLLPPDESRVEMVKQTLRHCPADLLRSPKMSLALSKLAIIDSTSL